MDTLPKFKLKEPLLMLVGSIFGIWWLVNTFNTGNPLWFLPIQPTYRPSRILVHDYGTAVTIMPGTNEYEILAQALDESLSGFKNTALSSLGLSDETLRRYNEEELVLEIFYPEEIHFNTPVRMSKINQLLIPIDATHSGKGYVFMGSSGAWRVGTMEMENDEPLLNAMRQLGYLQK